MSGLALATLIIALMLGLIALRVPIAIAMFLAGSVGYLWKAGWLPWAYFLNTEAYGRFASYDLSVIPLFILMGQFAAQGGLSKALFEFASAITARLRGGVAMGAVLASGAFGAICGSSVATAATITSVALPEMRRLGYSGRLATGALAAGGTLGFLIPPSVPLIIYAILAEQNLAKLFAAAMIPGAIAVLGYMIAIGVYVRLVPGQAPKLDAQTRRVTWLLLRNVLPIIGIFLLVFGGIYGGWFTPTEAAAVGTVAAFVAALLKGELTFARLLQCFYATAATTAMIFMILIGADMMNAALALSQVPGQLAAAVADSGLSPLSVVTAILLLYVVLGAVMDELSMMILTVPIFFPIVVGLDFGMPSESVALWFGIMVLMTVSFGLLAPPVGLNVYVVNGIAKDVPIMETYRGVMPFLASDLIRALLLLFFPAISLGVVKYLV